MDCNQCGECCKWIAMKTIGMSPEVLHYLKTRGCTVDDDYLLIPHRCKHLRLDVKLTEWRVEDDVRTPIVKRYRCEIHNKEEYPVLCRRFHGHGRYYIPEGCAFVQRPQDIKDLKAVSSKDRNKNGQRG